MERSTIQIIDKQYLKTLNRASHTLPERKGNPFNASFDDFLALLGERKALEKRIAKECNLKQ